MLSLQEAKQRLQRSKFFVYTASFVNILVNTGPQTTITIQPDSAFLVQKLTYFSNVVPVAAQTNNTRTIPKINILIVDNGSGEQLTDRALPLYEIFGTAENPMILPVPRLFQPNSTITITATNVDAVAYDLGLAFIGTKLY